MTISRRDFIKSQAAVAAAAAAGVSIPVSLTAARRGGRRQHPLGQGRLPFLWHRLLGAGGRGG